MSDFDPPQSRDHPEGQYAFDAEMASAVPAPMSGMAVAGFVTSVILCCPVTVLLGLIFSLIGVAHTRGGLRRGRGLAVAGVLIAVLLGIPANSAGWYWAFNFGRTQVVMTETMGQLNSGNIDTQVGKLYALTDDSFQAAVTESELVDWLEGHFQALGGLQRVTFNQRNPAQTAGQNVFYVFKLDFAEKPVTLELKARPVFRRGMVFEDFLFDDQSALEALGTESSPATQP